MSVVCFVGCTPEWIRSMELYKALHEKSTKNTLSKEETVYWNEVLTLENIQKNQFVHLFETCPDEIIFHISESLSFIDLVRWGRTSKRFKNLILVEDYILKTLVTNKWKKIIMENESINIDVTYLSTTFFEVSPINSWIKIAHLLFMMEDIPCGVKECSCSRDGSSEHKYMQEWKMVTFGKDQYDKVDCYWGICVGFNIRIGFINNYTLIQGVLFTHSRQQFMGLFDSDEKLCGQGKSSGYLMDDDNLITYSGIFTNGNLLCGSITSDFWKIEGNFSMTGGNYSTLQLIGDCKIINYIPFKSEISKNFGSRYGIKLQWNHLKDLIDPQKLEYYEKFGCIQNHPSNVLRLPMISINLYGEIPFCYYCYNNCNDLKIDANLCSVSMRLKTRCLCKIHLNIAMQKEMEMEKEEMNHKKVKYNEYLQ